MKIVNYCDGTLKLSYLFEKFPAEEDFHFETLEKEHFIEYFPSLSFRFGSKRKFTIKNIKLFKVL
jgi:hypothetical protein